MDTAVALGNRRLAVGTQFDLRIADLVPRTSRSVSLNHTVDALAWGPNEDRIFAIGATDVSIVDPSSAKKRSQVRASVPDDPILRAVYSPRAGGIWLDSQETLRFLPDGARAAYIAGKSGTRPDVIVESRKGNRLAVASGRTISLYNVTKRRAPSVSQNTAAR